MISVREKPPLRLHANIAVPSGPTFRWGPDEHQPENVVSDVSFSTIMPGGFEQATGTLARQSDRSFPDLAEFSTATLLGAGGEVAWQGRLERTPRVSGDKMAISPGLVGWQNHLDDNKNAREIFVDLDQTKWQQGPSTQRQINSAIALDGPSSSSDATSGVPSVITAMTFPWGAAHAAEAWYDARGRDIGSLYFAWKLGAGINPADGNWQWSAQLGSDDLPTASDSSGNLRAAGPGQGTTSATAQRKFAFLQLYYPIAVAGTAGDQATIYWTCLAVYGNHGLTKRGGQTATTTQGFYASDIVAYAVRSWAPKLAISRAGQSTIAQSAWIVEQAAFLDPTTASEIIKQVNRFELYDWWVDEGPTFNYAPRGSYGRSWRARVGPSQLSENGPQVDQIWNGVVVQYADVSGSARTVGPVGSGSYVEDASLSDSDSANPANTIPNLKRWSALQMGTSTSDGAIKVGQMFLQQQKLVNTSGDASLVGFVEDDRGVTWPAWKVRAGDTISFVDAADTSPRRIVKTEYSDSTKTCRVSLDSPPDALQVLLDRLSVSIAPLGFT